MFSSLPGIVLFSVIALFAIGLTIAGFCTGGIGLIASGIVLIILIIVGVIIIASRN